MTDIRALSFRSARDRFPALAASAFVLALSSSSHGQGSSSCNRTYTFDADFDEGSLINVNHDAPNNHQLQLNEVTTPLPFVNIACSARGTVVRIDVNTGQILGEYFTAPQNMGRDPSRTTVDLFGNVWVANRQENGGGKGSIARIGLVIGGTRVDADGTPNPSGLYLKPPFDYSTAVDRDGDGLIKTSRGLGDFLPWPNTLNADSNGGVSTAEDESIINYTRVTGTLTRTVAVDANNDVWVGGTGDLDHEKVSGVTGLPVPNTQFNQGCGGYGGLVDGCGILWSARQNGLLRYDTSTMSGTCLGTALGDYGLGIDPATGHIWHTRNSGNQVVEFDCNGTLLHTYAHGSNFAQGVAVDGVGNVWVAHALGSTSVGHLRTDGTYVGNISLLPNGSGPTGVAIDANGKVWVAIRDSNNAKRIDPNAGPIGGGGFPIGAVDLTVDLGPNAGPYNYSDMTGFVAIGTTSPSGTWTVVRDGQTSGTDWGKVSWNSLEPVGTSVSVEVRAADNVTDLPGQVFVAVSNGVSFCKSPLQGRFLEIRTTLSREPTVLASPVLFDLTVECCVETPSCVERNRRQCGSLLLYPEFDNRPGIVTMISVTDGCCDSSSGNTQVEFRFINKDNCLETNQTFTLTPCDQLTFLTNVANSGGSNKRGYAYVFAKKPVVTPNNANGTPTVWNHLIGQELILNGITALNYSMNAVSFQGIGREGELDDDDGDGVRDLNGPGDLAEYEEAPEEILVPRFLAQDDGVTAAVYRSEIILINLSGGSAFTTIVDILGFNDNEEPLSAQYTFRCWDKPLLRTFAPFTLQSFLLTTDHAANEIVGASQRESGWMVLDGLVANSAGPDAILDPAIYAVLIEIVGGYSTADLPFERCSQVNGDLLPHDIFGDGPDAVAGDDQ